jgi:hypothetical protein
MPEFQTNFRGIWLRSATNATGASIRESGSERGKSMDWNKINESYYELRSRGNVEAMLKRTSQGWHCFLDAVDMVSLVHVGVIHDLAEAKKATKKALSLHREQRAQPRSNHR